MTLVTRLLTVALVAGLGLTFSGTVAAAIQSGGPTRATSSSHFQQPLATRNATFRYDGRSVPQWSAADAADAAMADAQTRAEFAARLDAAIVDLTPAPEPAPVPVIVAVAAPATAPRANPAPPPPAPTYTGSVPDLIRAVFAAAGQEGVDWALRVAKCESGFNPNSYNASSGASGVFQFMPATWRGSPYASSSPFDANANVRAALWLYQRSGPNQWSCK